MEHDLNVNTYTFKDRKGRQWDLTLTLAGARSIEASDFSEVNPDYGKGKFSFLNPDKTFFATILADTNLVVAMIWALVQPQAPKVLGMSMDDDEARKAAEAEFLDGFTGPVIVEARKTFWESLASFFPTHRTTLEALVRQLQAAQERMATKMGEMEERMKKTLDKEVDKALAKLREELTDLGGKSTE